MPSDAKTCVVVGAGISGLAAARALVSAGWSVTVLDKGRRVGGRMATRRVGEATFDHGAQFFTVRGERFQALVDEWLDAGAASEWSRGFANAKGDSNEDGHPRYRGSEGMTSIPKHLARGLDVRTSERVVVVNAGEDGWDVICESGTRATADNLLLTAPVPQSLALAESGNFEIPDSDRKQLAEVSYDPCLALMAALDEPCGVPEPGGMQIKSEPLDWIGDNQQKGISSSPGITIHGGPQWSRKHYEDEESGIIDALTSLAEDYLGTVLRERILESSLARWRYSWVTNPHPEPYLLASEEPGLLFAGDAFGQPKVEGAALSGLAAADLLLGRER